MPRDYKQHWHDTEIHLPFYPWKTLLFNINLFGKLPRKRRGQISNCMKKYFALNERVFRSLRVIKARNGLRRIVGCSKHITLQGFIPSVISLSAFCRVCTYVEALKTHSCSLNYYEFKEQSHCPSPAITHELCLTSTLG